MKNKLYLIPSDIGSDPMKVIPAATLEHIARIGVFVVENVRSARRFLSAAGLKGRIDGLEFHELSEHTSDSEVEALLPLFDKGDVGLITEAGLPAVADPGAPLVALCHAHGIQVVPLTGPSSLMLALMASGLNGQEFAFVGYLPAKTAERRDAVKKIEKDSSARRQTQIFIETPYRNDALLEDLVNCLSPGTMLCIAADITLESETIITLPVSAWRRKAGFKIGKRPCVFLILAR
ncbi:MAG: SAM-dependent methyltransferase [Bacteroidales bacterium]|nr:SAM-dependent methyltransferase [Bacteroidales bacterium]